MRVRAASGLLYLGQLSACTAGVPLCELDTTVPPSLQSSVLLEWETDYLARSWVEYEVDGHSMSTTMSTHQALEHSHSLLSLPPVSTVDYQAFTETDRVTRSCRGQVNSGNPPGTIPRYTVTVHEPDLVASRYVLIVNASDDRGSVVVVNREGEIVWYRERSTDQVMSMADFDVSTGELLLFHQDAHRLDPELSELERLTWTGECQETRDLYGGHHAWVQHDDGSLAWLAVDVRERPHPETGEIVEVVGDQLVLSALDGSETILFSTWDWLELESNPLFDFPYYAGRSDWTHANGLSYSADRDTYLVSLGNLDQVLELDRQSGALLASMGGEGAVYTEGSSIINFPHSPRWTDDGNLLLTTTDGTTFAVEYAVEEPGGELRQVWSHGQDEEIFAAALGEVQELANGGRVVCYGMGARIQEIDARGEVVWELEGRAGRDRLTSIRLLDDLWELP